MNVALMEFSISSTRSAVRIACKARQLWRFHARATRLLVRSPGKPEGLERSRRLYRHVLRKLEIEAEPSADAVELGRQAARAIRDLSWPMRRGALRGACAALGLFAVVGGLIAILSWISPAVRQRLFPPDLGRTARYEASSVMQGHSQRGVGTYARGEVFFHTNSQKDPHIELDFGRPVRVRKVHIENRRDCCGERALPLDVKAVGASGERFLCQRRAPFRSWTCDAGGVVTERLRIEVPGHGMLHLRSIEVYE
jgi:hypothetical protein